MVHQLPNNDLRLRISGNRKIIVKAKNEIGTRASIQSLFQTSIFGASGQNLQKLEHQSFLVLSNFA